jgi:hypothetical protein
VYRACIIAKSSAERCSPIGCAGKKISCAENLQRLRRKSLTAAQKKKLTAQEKNFAAQPFWIASLFSEFSPF